MMLKTRFMAGIAGCALAANSVAFAAAVVTQTFESGTESWTGDGTATNGTYTVPAPAGLPISGMTLPADNKILAVEGTASYTDNTVGATTNLVDMMIKASIPDDALAAPEEENVQVAVAVDSDKALKVYCKTNDTAAGWCPLGETVAADDWVRVSLKFDYANNRCQVRINGEPKMTANGYYTADGTATGGSWYKLVTTPANTTAKIAGLSVSGCTAIDEVVLDKSDSPQYQIAGSTDSTKTLEGGTVPLKWFDDYGIAWSESDSAKYGEYSAKDSYLRCLSPFDDQKFEVKSVTVDTAKKKTVVGIPATVDTVGRKVVLQSSSDSTFATGTTTTDVAAGQETVEVALPAAGAVQYFRLRAMDK